MRVRGNLVHYTSYITKDQYHNLVKLKEATRVPVSAYIREGIDMVLKKHGDGK